MIIFTLIKIYNYNNLFYIGSFSLLYFIYGIYHTTYTYVFMHIYYIHHMSFIDKDVPSPKLTCQSE